jgi:hypothetical protein
MLGVNPARRLNLRIKHTWRKMTIACRQVGGQIDHMISSLKEHICAAPNRMGLCVRGTAFRAVARLALAGYTLPLEQILRAFLWANHVRAVEPPLGDHVMVRATFWVRLATPYHLAVVVASSVARVFCQ